MPTQAIGRGAPRAARPLLLVVVDPDDDQLKGLIGLAARVQARPATPLYLLIAQTQPRSAGRELYAQLPALILSGGNGPVTLLPGQGEWPKRGEARLLGRAMRVAGRAIMVDEVAIAQALTPLRRQGMELPPVLWDAPEPILAAPAALAAPAHIPNGSESTAAEQDTDERRRRIAEVMARRRQVLMDAEHVAAPVMTEQLAPVATAIATPIADEQTASLVTSHPALMTGEETAPVVLDTAVSALSDEPRPAAAAQDHPAPAAPAPALPVLADASTLVAPAPTLPVLVDAHTTGTGARVASAGQRSHASGRTGDRG